MSSKKLPVSINIFPSLDYVELVQFDERSGEIDRASALPCQFDAVSRQMTDRDQMAQTIRDLFNMNRIPFGTPVILVLPSFFTREIELPAEFSKDELRFALVSEAERFYMFKKAEPQIDWVTLEEGRFLYSAFPKTEIEKYLKIFQELKIPLTGIELSYLSIMRGLAATGAISQEVESGERWCLLAISDSSFYTSIQDGMTIRRTMDAPLSITSDDDLSTVQEILQDFEAFIESDTFAKLVVVNNSTRLNSDDLLCRLAFQGSVTLVEQTALTLRSRGASDAPFPCSLEGIGGVFYSQFPEMPSMNFMSDTGENLAGVLEYRRLTMKWLLISNAGVFVICLLIWGLLALILWQKDQEREALSAQASKMGASINAQQVNDVNRKKFIKKVVDQNVRINNFLVKAGGATKEDLWFEKIALVSEKLDTPPLITLEGRALNLDSVNTMLAALTQTMKDANLQVSNAAPATSEDGQSYFTWTIQSEEATETPAASPNQVGGVSGR